MTNFEYLNNLASNGDIEAVAEMFYKSNRSAEQWCLEQKSECCSICKNCFINWLKEKHIEPMPKLIPGMFVKTHSIYDKPEDDDDLGVIIPFDRGNIIAYKDGGFDWMVDVDECAIIIKEIYKAVSFNNCDETTRIWKRES